MAIFYKLFECSTRNGGDESEVNELIVYASIRKVKILIILRRRNLVVG